MLQNFNIPPYDDAYKERYPLRFARRHGTTCKFCGDKFKPQNSRGPVPEYCSRSCQSKAYRRRKWAELERAA